jgi:hypothetical protein
MINGHPTEGWTGSEPLVEVWLQVFELAGEAEITPWDALLLAVRRRAARVLWCDQMVAAAIQRQRAEERAERDDDPDYATPAADAPFVPDSSVRAWLVESRNEERLMTRAAKMAIDAGVAEAVIRRLELEGRLVTETLVAGMDAIELSPEQRMTMLEAAHKKLLAIEG